MWRSKSENKTNINSIVETNKYIEKLKKGRYNFLVALVDVDQ